MAIVTTPLIAAVGTAMGSSVGRRRYSIRLAGRAVKRGDSPLKRLYLRRAMLLAININNTETKVGLFRGDSLEAHWRLTTAPARTPDEWAAVFTAYLLQARRSTQEVRAAVDAAVVPPVTQGICEAVERATTVPPVIVDGRSALPIVLDVDEPLSVGADRPDAVRHRDGRARQPGRAAGARDRGRAPRFDAGGTPDRGHGARPQVVAGGASRGGSAWRRWGYRLLPGDGFSYLLHLRPAEWPIMAAHTALGYLLAVGLRGAGSGERLLPALW